MSKQTDIVIYTSQEGDIELQVSLEQQKFYEIILLKGTL